MIIGLTVFGISPPDLPGSFLDLAFLHPAKNHLLTASAGREGEKHGKGQQHSKTFFHFLFLTL